MTLIINLLRKFFLASLFFYFISKKSAVFAESNVASLHLIEGLAARFRVVCLTHLRVQFQSQRKKSVQ